MQPGTRTGRGSNVLLKINGALAEQRVLRLLVRDQILSWCKFSIAPLTSAELWFIPAAGLGQMFSKLPLDPACTQQGVIISLMWQRLGVRERMKNPLPFLWIATIKFRPVTSYSFTLSFGLSLLWFRPQCSFWQHATCLIQPCGRCGRLLQGQEKRQQIQNSWQFDLERNLHPLRLIAFRGSIKNNLVYWLFTWVTTSTRKAKAGHWSGLLFPVHPNKRAWLE